MHVRVVWGTAEGPTEMAAYDAALAAAGIHDHNLRPVSSVLPAEATVEAVGTAPELGPAGSALTVVEATATTAGPGRVSAALGWSGGPGPGIVYEAADATDEADVRDRVERGLAAGRALRDWRFEDGGLHSVTADADPGTYTAAAVLAVLGEATPLG